MFCLVTNTRTNEVRSIKLTEWPTGDNPIPITIEQAADKLIKRISYKYPNVYKLIHNPNKHISIRAGNVTRCVFELQFVEQLKDYDDSFFS